MRDFFLRRKMDSEGYLPVALIATFHRIKTLTNDITLLINAISASDKLELSDTMLKVSFIFILNLIF